MTSKYIQTDGLADFLMSADITHTIGAGKMQSFQCFIARPLEM